MQDDPRLSSRFPCRAKAVLICLPHLYEVTLIDVSVHGVLVGPKGNVEIGVGDHARLRVLTERGNHAFEIEARVVHRSEQGVGLEIHSVDHHARSSLCRLIEASPGALDVASRSLPVGLKEKSPASPAP